MRFKYLKNTCGVVITHWWDSYLLKWFCLHKSILVILFIAHFMASSIWLLKEQGFLQPLELYGYDGLLTWQPRETNIDSRITLVWLEDEDQRLYGWPLADKELLSVFQKLQSHQPLIIGLDIYRDSPVPRNSTYYTALIDWLKQQSNIILIKKFRDEQGKFVRALPEFEHSHKISFNDLTVDSGGLIRRGLLYLSDGERTYEAFSLKLALAFFFKHKIKITSNPANSSELILGKTILSPLDANFGGYVNADTGGFQFMLDYPAAPSEFNHLNIRDILKDNIDTNLIRDKIVIIGVRAEGTPDFLYTPFGRWIAGDERVAGAAVHAYIVSQLLNIATDVSQPLQSLSDTQESLWLWLTVLLAAVLMLSAHSMWFVGIMMVGGNALIIAISFVAFQSGLWITMASPLLGFSLTMVTSLIYLSNQEKQQRAVLMQLFSRHVSKEVANVIWAAREQYLRNGRLRPQRLTATVLFTDLQNFTSVAEQMEPQVLMDWLNEYMEVMVQVVEEQHHGQVNKFIGDAIMALFGVPLASQNTAKIQKDTINAVECALAMREALATLTERWQQRGLPQIRMRIGIYTGELVAGSLGSAQRQEYTVLGDTVNIASRLESFDKEIDKDVLCRILIGESTLHYLPPRFATEFVGEVVLKGKVEGVRVYRVI